MRAVMRWLWKWSWIITGPISIAFVYWGLETADQYYTFAVRYRPDPVQLTLRGVGLDEADLLASRLLHAVKHWSGSDQPTHMRQINLYVEEGKLAKLEQDPPHSGFEYVRGGMLQDGRMRKIKLRYRGDFVDHWRSPKKSMRIKTKKGRLFDGMRRFNVIAPGVDLRNHLGYLLGTHLNLMTPKSEMVWVNSNGRSSGVFNLVEQPRELLLRRHGRMPGDLYMGELLAKDAYYGATSMVFEHAGLWEKAAVNNHFPEESHAPLEKLLALINAPQSQEVQTSLMELLDMERWGHFAALETLALSYHYDRTHNWRLYYDPWRTRFEPVVWDPNGWVTEWMAPDETGIYALDVAPTRFHRVLQRNYDFLRARQRAIAGFFRSGHDEVFLEEVRSEVAKTTEALRNDPSRAQHAANLLDDLNRLPAEIEKVFDRTRKAYLSGSMAFLAEAEPAKLTFRLDGRAVLETLIMEQATPLDRPVGARLIYVLDGVTQEIDVSGAVTIGGSRIRLDLGLMARHIPTVVGDHPLKAWRLRVAPAYYTLVFDGMDPGAKTERILADWGDGPVEIREVVEASPVGFERSFNVANARPHTEPLVWKGRVKVSGVQRVDRDLVIEPGTVIELESGAGVIVGGQLRAEGTAAAPIQFVPANPDGAPWGTIALRGPGAAGSVLRHCRMSGGSGLKEPTYEYSAMFSVHDVPGVRVAECQFSDSRIVDDMVHVVYGDVEFSNCVFLRALSDALDLDITHATIRECQFEQSGNDALDLMSTAAVVYDTSLSRNGDKGISVGEASQLIAVNVTISENEIGVQSKDGSAATLINASLAGNRVGVDAYKKNWRYQAGGQLFIYKSVFDGNGKAITADKKSQIVVEDSYLDADVDNPGKKVRIRIGASVDSNDAKSARFPSFERVSADKVEFPGMGQALERIDPRRRGAHTPER